MTLPEPETTEDIVYFTQRTLDNDGYARVWVLRTKCPECGENKMSKPKHPDGRYKVRAKEYVCEECDYSVPKEEYQESLDANVLYTCPECGHKGEKQLPFKRTKYKGKPALKVPCDECDEVMIIGRMKRK